MPAPFRPDTGLNRAILDALVDYPGVWPGRLARVVDHDAGTVKAALGRLEARGLVTMGSPDGLGRREVTATAAGLRIVGKRRARSRPLPVPRPQRVRNPVSADA